MPRCPTTPHAPAGEPNGSHSGSLSLGDIDDDTIAAIGGEAPPEGILNVLFFQLSVPLIFIDFKFRYS